MRAKATRDQVPLATPLARRRRPGRLPPVEASLDPRRHLLRLWALENLQQQISAGSKQSWEQDLYGLQQALLGGPVHVSDTRELGSRVAQDDVCRLAPESFEDQATNRRIFQISLHYDHVRILEGRIDGHPVHTDRYPAGTHDLGGDLEEASRPAAQIHDPLPGLQDLVLLLEIQELVGRTRAIAFALGALVEVVFPFGTNGLTSG